MGDIVGGKFISLDHKPLKFTLGSFGPISGGEGIYFVKFEISEVDQVDNEIPSRSFTHVFVYGWRWKGYQYFENRDLQQYVNCLRDIVIDGQYDIVDDKPKLVRHTILNGVPNDIYASRLMYDISNEGILYSRPTENLVRERVLIRNVVIKSLYKLGTWIEWKDLMQKVHVEPKLLKQTCDYLDSANLIHLFETNKYQITASGSSHFEKQIMPSTNLVFIIASCDKKYKDWIEYYKEEIKANGLKPYFQEHEEPPREIIMDIYEQLRNCAFVLADITDGRENCLYELGYAHALGKKIILIRDDADVREDKDNEVRITFDLNQFKHSFRNGSEKPESEINSEFRNDLKDRILKVKAALFESQFNFTSE